eukprot:Lankesteria_metandrocarpae@DN980_c0_g1_i1.p1
MSTGSYSKHFGGGHWASHGEYMWDKNEKLKAMLKEDSEGSDKTSIFAGCIVNIDGRSCISDYHLKRLMFQHGGEYEPYNLKRVTHIVADNVALGNQRWQHFKNRGSKKFVTVTSKWIVDSINANRRLPEGRYRPDALQDNPSVANIFQNLETGNAVDTTIESSVSGGQDAVPISCTVGPTVQVIGDCIDLIECDELDSSSSDNCTSGSDNCSTGSGNYTTGNTPNRHVAAGTVGRAGVENTAAIDSTTCRPTHPTTAAATGTAGNGDIETNNLMNVHTDELYNTGTPQKLKSSSVPGQCTGTGTFVLGTGSPNENQLTGIDKGGRVTVSTPVRGSTSSINLECGAKQIVTGTASTASANTRRLVATTDPNFVSSFFSASRLHVIGKFKDNIYAKFSFAPFTPIKTHHQHDHETAMQCYRQFGVNHAVCKQKSTPTSTLLSYFGSNANANANSALPRDPSKVLHIDFDAFFVAVALRNKPAEWHQRPVGVAHSTGEGKGEASMSELASMNYPARAYGLHKGMFAGHARQLCPDLQILPYDFDGIRDCSEALYDCLTAISARVLPISCDEAYLQLFGTEQCAASKVIGRQLREAVFKRTQCTASVGIGSNRLLAKLSGQSCKPSSTDYA